MARSCRYSSQDYDDLRSMSSEKSLLVFAEPQDKGVVSLTYSLDSLNYELRLSEEYSDPAHLEALKHIAENYRDENLPEEIEVSDLETVSSAMSSSEIDVEWEPEIEVNGRALNTCGY